MGLPDFTRSLGTGLSNLKYFSDAISTGERIVEAIKRVSKIDSDNIEGEIPEDVSGEVEFRNVEFFPQSSRPETIIFKDFCLKILAGKALALVGSSGSGKVKSISL